MSYDMFLCGDDEIPIPSEDKAFRFISIPQWTK